MYNINICLQVARCKSTVRARIHTCGPMKRLCIKELLYAGSWHCNPWKMNSVTFCINCLSDLTAYELNLIPDCSNFDSWLYNVLYIYYFYSVLVVTVQQHNTHVYLVITLSPCFVDLIFLVVSVTLSNITQLVLSHNKLTGNFLSLSLLSQILSCLISNNPVKLAIILTIVRSRVRHIVK